MSRPFEVRPPLETAYRRGVQFAVELLDAVTLARVSEGVKLVAYGLRGQPVVNAGGLFVWLKEDLAALERITIDPGRLPYESAELRRGDLQDPPRPTTVELQPRVDYPFAAGVTGLRGTLIEEQTAPPRRPVRDAAVHLRWLDEDGVTWRDAPTISHTNTNGDFVAILRLPPAAAPRIDASGTLTVRLRASREGVERGSADLKLPQGRVADPSTFAPGPDALVFAWDELQP